VHVKLAIAALCCLLAVPSLALAWGAKGSLEPDTAVDRSAGYQWADADTAPCGVGAVTTTGCDVNRVYLNGFITQNADTHYDHGSSSLNPNFATLGTAHPSWMGQAAALIGVWKDCNADGYIGLGDNGLLEYRTEVLNAQIAAGLAPAGICPVKATAPSHNDGTWVHELIAIGPDQANVDHGFPDANKWDLNDENARVWMDWNQPGDLPPPNRCYIFMPASADPTHPEWGGAMHSTGGLLAFADCWDDETITQTVDAVATPNSPLAPFSFADHPTEQWNSSSQLNQRNPWGEPGDAPIVDTWACPTALGPSAGGFQLHQPAVPPTTNTAGTLAGTAEVETDGAIDCDPKDDAPASAGGSGNGQNSYVVANLPYSTETGGVIQVVGPKIAADFLLQYGEGFRPAATSAVFGPSGGKTGGVEQAGDADGIWLATATISENSNPYVNRADIRGEPVSPVEYVTTYAYVTRTDVTLSPTGTVGTYGALNCGSFTTGVHGGWDCDATRWYPGVNCANPTTSPAADCVSYDGGTHDITVRPGQPFNLMDVDCYDNSVSGAREAGVGWGALTGTSCD
jgi:hypothetical protein